ncbi:MAG: PadR family transcriptional regulator [Nevskiales bacterium]
MSLKHVILVLLNKKPGSGYDLVQRFNSGLGNFWNASHQQVYQELKKLHKERLVEFEVEAQSARPDKKVYRITKSGQRRLKTWLAEPAKPPRVNDALLVKVFGAQPAEIPALVKELDRHIELRRKNLARYLQMEQPYFEQDSATRHEYRLPYLTLRRGIRYERDWIEWLTETRELLAKDQLPAKPVLQTRR